jgi:uncharacterized protein (DUF885 family)
VEEGLVERHAVEATRVADAYVAEFVARFPVQAELQGLSVERPDRLTDNSLTALHDWRRLEDGWAAVLDGIDPESLRGRPEWVTYGFVREAIDASRRLRICRNELWPVNHLSGWQAELAHLAGSQPVGREPARADALARWAGLPSYLDTEMENLREGLRVGYSTPRHAVELVIDQLDTLLASPIEQWPFFSPAERDGSSDFVAAWRILLLERVGQAVERYRSFLRDDYVTRAREVLSITAHPDGEACYAAAFRASTTIDRPGVETLELALQRVDANLDEALEIGRVRFGTPDLPSLVARIAGDPANHFENREDKLRFARDAVARSRERVPDFFAHWPRADVVVEPFPPHLERDAEDSYWPAAEDGSRPARYLIGLHDVAAATRSNAEITAFHEGYPGHHLQDGLAHEQASAHAITRLVYNDGFVEGWARYAEAIAEEMGLYTSDYAAANRRLWPGRGMAADPGIHLFGWSRERAATFMAESGRMTAEEADATVDRISVWPGQFAAYDTGGLELRALRAEAEQRLGASFDIRAFHDAVIGNGSVTLPMLRDQVRAWIERTAANGPA